MKKKLLKAEAGNTWGCRLLELNNIVIQWVETKMRYRGENKPFRFDLIFTKRVDL